MGHKTTPSPALPSRGRERRSHRLRSRIPEDTAMGKVTGFLEIEREEPRYEPASDRIRHFGEFTIPMSEGRIVDQAARCMDCGVPYCHGDTGCPVNNQIPDWNDLVYNGDWEEAARNLHSTNN